MAAVRGVKEPFFNAPAGRRPSTASTTAAAVPRAGTHELLDESTLLPPQTSEEWQRETAFADFLRERDVACN